MIDDALLEQILAPPRETEDLADVGGVIRARPEDFAVEEIPAYESDGRPGHLFFDLRKRGLTTEEAVRELAHQLKVPRPEIGVAGLKDREAVTRQRVSVPDRAASALASFAHPAIELGPAEPHSHKLRRGHLRGNRFVLVIRELPQDQPGGLEQARARAQAKLDRLVARGLRNYYGGQRFGKDGRNVAPGLAALAGKGPRRAKADLVVSAGQSALFNLYLAERARRGLLDRVLVGDILQKRATGGMFESTDADADQARLDAGELVVTGPMFGSKTRSPSPETPADALEQEILASVAGAGLTPAKLARLGRKVPGARRQLRIWPDQVSLALAPECPELELSAGLEVGFTLPPGSYATVLIRELCG